MITGQMHWWRLLWLRGTYGLLAVLMLAVLLNSAFLFWLGFQGLGRFPSTSAYCFSLGVVLMAGGLAGFWFLSWQTFRVVCRYRYANGRLNYTPILPFVRTRELSEVDGIRTWLNWRTRDGCAMIRWRGGGNAQLVFWWLANSRQLAEQLRLDYEQKAPDA
jgi:hypothetical protein